MRASKESGGEPPKNLLLVTILVLGLLLVNIVGTQVLLSFSLQHYGKLTITTQDIQASDWLGAHTPQNSSVGVFGYNFWSYWVQYYSHRYAFNAAEGSHYLSTDSTFASEERLFTQLSTVAAGRFSLEDGVVKVADSYFAGSGRPIVYLNLGEYQGVLSVDDSQVWVEIAGVGWVSLSNSTYSLLDTSNGQSMVFSYSQSLFNVTKIVTLRGTSVLIDYRVSSSRGLMGFRWNLSSEYFFPIVSTGTLGNATNITQSTSVFGSQDTFSSRLNFKGTGNVGLSSTGGDLSATMLTSKVGDLNFSADLSFMGPYYGTVSSTSFSDSCATLSQAGVNYVYVRTLFDPQRYDLMLQYLATAPYFKEVFSQGGIEIFRVIGGSCIIPPVTGVGT